MKVTHLMVLSAVFFVAASLSATVGTGNGSAGEAAIADATAAGDASSLPQAAEAKYLLVSNDPAISTDESSDLTSILTKMLEDYSRADARLLNGTAVQAGTENQGLPFVSDFSPVTPSPARGAEGLIYYAQRQRESCTVDNGCFAALVTWNIRVMDAVYGETRPVHIAKGASGHGPSTSSLGGPGPVVLGQPGPGQPSAGGPEPMATPEPGSMALLASGIFALGSVTRSKWSRLLKGRV